MNDSDASSAYSLSSFLGIHLSPVIGLEQTNLRKIPNLFLACWLLETFSAKSNKRFDNIFFVVTKISELTSTLFKCIVPMPLCNKARA